MNWHDPSAQVPGRLFFDNKPVPDPPRSLRAFAIRLLATETYQGPERRGTKRHPVVLPVAVMPLDDALRPKDEVFAAITGDLSTAGIRLISTRAATSEFLAIEFTRLDGQNTQVVLRVFRCRAIGRFYELAGELISKSMSSCEAAPRCIETGTTKR
jgi:hypothetical protein